MDDIEDALRKRPPRTSSLYKTEPKKQLSSSLHRVGTQLLVTTKLRFSFSELTNPPIRTKVQVSSIDMMSYQIFREMYTVPDIDAPPILTMPQGESFDPAERARITMSRWIDVPADQQAVASDTPDGKGAK
jgi:hypothetical protein